MLASVEMGREQAHVMSPPSRKPAKVWSGGVESPDMGAMADMPEFLNTQEFLSHIATTLPQHHAKSLTSAITDRTINWNKEGQIPIGLLKVMADGKSLKGNKELEPSLIGRAREELERRRGGGKRMKSLAEAGGSKPTVGLPIGAHEHGSKSLYNWLKAGGTGERQSEHPSYFSKYKTHNKYDMRTWRKGLLDSWAHHKHSALASEDIRKRWREGKTIPSDRQHLLKQSDGYLFERELVRRGGGKSVRADTERYRRGETSPPHHNPKAPEQSPRGVGGESK